MGNELVSDSLPEDKQSKDSEGNSLTSCYGDIFNERFPYYLSIGMTEAQYWDGDCELTKYYRKAEVLRQNRVNQEAWLQGRYVYDAIARISPILHAFAKKGTQAEPYVEEPYPITRKQAEEVQRKKEESSTNQGLQFMRSLMSSVNKKYEGK